MIGRVLYLPLPLTSSLCVKIGICWPCAHVAVASASSTTPYSPSGFLSCFLFISAAWNHPEAPGFKTPDSKLMLPLRVRQCRDSLARRFRVRAPSRLRHGRLCIACKMTPKLGGFPARAKALRLKRCEAMVHETWGLGGRPDAVGPWQIVCGTLA